MSLDSTHTNINPGVILPGLGNALSSEVSQATVESAMNAVAFSHPFVHIARFLDPDSLSKLSCTSRAWRDFTRNKELWQMLLQRDFGEKAVSKAGGNFKDAYMENFNRLRGFIKELPRGQQLLEDSRIDALRETVLHKAEGVLSLRCLDEYIRGLSKCELDIVFCRSVELWLIPVVISIVESFRFDEINANGPYGLGGAFVLFAENNLIQAMQLIMQHPRFGEIDANGRWGLGAAFEAAAYFGNVIAMKLIMQHPRFGEIDVNEWRGLGHALVMTAWSDCVKARQLIMENYRFAEIAANGVYGLGHALLTAAYIGHVKSMQPIMKHPRFAEIAANGEYGLGDALARAACFGHVEAMQLIMENYRFAEIDANGEYGYALAEAAINGRIESMKLIMEHPRFGEIDANGRWGLGAVLASAARRGLTDAIDLIMDDPRFVEIDKAMVFYAIRQAPISVGLHILKKWPVAYLTGIFVEDYMSSSLT